MAMLRWFSVGGSRPTNPWLWYEIVPSHRISVLRFEKKISACSRKKCGVLKQDVCGVASGQLCEQQMEAAPRAQLEEEVDDTSPARSRCLICQVCIGMNGGGVKPRKLEY